MMTKQDTKKKKTLRDKDRAERKMTREGWRSHGGVYERKVGHAERWMNDRVWGSAGCLFVYGTHYNWLGQSSKCRKTLSERRELPGECCEEGNGF